MPSFAARREMAGLRGLAGNVARGVGLFTAPQWMPAIFNQGQASSPLTRAVNRAADVVPGLRPNPQTDLGRNLSRRLGLDAAGNELRYMGQTIMRGQTPYSAVQAPQQRPAPGPGAGSGSPGAAPPPPVLPPPVGQAPAQRQGQAPPQRQGQSSRASVVSAPQVPGTAVGNVAAVPRFDMTPQGQYDRYFTDNQMDRYFGGRPGANAPKDMEAMQAAAMLPQAPTSMGLSDYYRSQSAAGRAGMDDIVNLMGYTGDMERWARANPMIAQREFAKQFPAGVANTGLVMNMPQPSAQLNPAGPEYALESGERIYNFGSDQISPEMIQAFQEKLRQQARR